MNQPQQPTAYNPYQPGAAYYQQPQPQLQPQYAPQQYQQGHPAHDSFSAQPGYGNAPPPHSGTNYPAQQPQKKEEKKGFFSKVKGFFGK